MVKFEKFLNQTLIKICTKTSQIALFFQMFSGKYAPESLSIGNVAVRYATLHTR